MEALEKGKHKNKVWLNNTFLKYSIACLVRGERERKERMLETFPPVLKALFCRRENESTYYSKMLSKVLSVSLSSSIFLHLTTPDGRESIIMLEALFFPSGGWKRDCLQDLYGKEVVHFYVKGVGVGGARA